MRVASAVIAVVLLAACTPDRTVTPVSDVTLAAASSSNTSVTSNVADADSTIAPALQIRSDGLGAYRNSNTLTSLIQSIGAWVLDSYTPRNSTRGVYLDFSQPIAGSGPNGGDPVAIPSGVYKVHMISKCNLYGNNMLTLAPGATMSCPLHVGDVYVGSVKYAVQMNPFNSAADTAYAETNYATVTCVVPSSGSGPCTQWRITPSGTVAGGSGNVGKLLKFVTSHGSTTAVNQGDFTFSFAITVTNP